MNLILKLVIDFIGRKSDGLAPQEYFLRGALWMNADTFYAIIVNLSIVFNYEENMKKSIFFSKF
jgi:hypothetical protein